MILKYLKQQIPNIIDNVVNVDLTASSLIDEKTVDRDVYEYLVMSFRDNMELIESVNVNELKWLL